MINAPSLGALDKQRPSSAHGRLLTTPALLTLAASTGLALTFFLGYRLRVASGVDAPAPGSAATKALEYGVFVLILAASALTATRNRVPRAWLLSVAGIGGSCVAMMYLSPAASEPRTAVRYIVCSAVVALSPRVWMTLRPSALNLTLVPLEVLLLMSVPTYIISSEYLFPWYNTWGLVAALMLAHCLMTSGSRHSVRHAVLVGACLFGIALSTSRQGVLALALIALVAILSSRTFSQWVSRTAAVGVVALSVAYMLTTSDRLSSIGGLSSNNGRGDLFTAARAFIEQYPILGIGAVNVRTTYHDVLLLVGQGWSDSAHNIFLDSWIRGGILGAASCALLLITLLRVPSGLLSPYAYAAVVTLPFFFLGSQLLFIEGTAAGFVVGLSFGLSQRGSLTVDQ